MKLIHYTFQPIEKIVIKYDYSHPFPRGDKPLGLWVSVEDGHGWKDWCEGEQFGLERLKYAYEVTLTDDANILYLETPKAIRSFSNEYEAVMDGGFIAAFGSKVTEAIRWDKVAEKYQGIIIAPYHWECRLELDTVWYYGWDCSSGCLWDLTCIKEFKLSEIYEKANELAYPCCAKREEDCKKIKEEK